MKRYAERTASLDCSLLGFHETPIGPQQSYCLILAMRLEDGNLQEKPLAFVPRLQIYTVVDFNIQYIATSNGTTWDRILVTSLGVVIAPRGNSNSPMPRAHKTPFRTALFTRGAGYSLLKNI